MKRKLRTAAPVLLAAIIGLSMASCQKQAATGSRPVASQNAPPPAQSAAREGKPGAVTLVHVHGLSYSPDGKQIIIPSHFGLAIYSNAHWSKAPGPEHDYMGFSATHNAFYSSGHPAQGTNLVNPFGFLKSQNGGQTWQKLGMEGQGDFHTMTASYGTNAVYVVARQPNDRMPTVGMYYTRNDGLQWTKAAATGLGGDPNSLVVHPMQANIVADGTDNGLYLSEDLGNHFKQVVAGKQVVSEMFDLDGKHLWYGSYNGRPELTRMDWQTGNTDEAVLPDLGQDAVSFIAQNPVDHHEMAIATFNRSVYLSKDQGKTWQQIANHGDTL